MYPSADHIPKHLNVTLTAQVPSSVHQPRADGYAHDCLLGKRHTILNHHVFHSGVNYVDDSPCSFKRQRVATQVNTRHMALHFPHSRDQCSTLVPIQNSINKSLLPREPEANQLMSLSKSNNIIFSFSEIEGNDINAQLDLTHDLTHDISPSSNNNAFAHTFDRLILADDALDKVQPASCIVQGQQTQSCDAFSQEASNRSALDLEYEINTAGISHHRGVLSLQRVQSWANAIKHICDDRATQCLYHDLFGDKPTFGANDPNLLKLLKEIDKQKDLVTLQEERFTNLAEEIHLVLKTCQSTVDKKIIRLGTRILDNFYQRFERRRFRWRE